MRRHFHPRRFRLLPGQQSQHHPGRERGHVGQRGADRRQAWGDPVREGQVVEADHADVGRDAQAQFGGGPVGAQRLVVNCGGPGILPQALPPELVQALRTTAAHSTLALADTNSTAILDDGSLGRGVSDVGIERFEDNDSSRLQAAHDGYVRSFGLVHQRTVVLGNDGKEVRGNDQLLPKGRKKIREAAPFAIRFHLAPGIEATATADGMGAILRPPGAPPWNFRCRGAMLQVEESLFIDGEGRAVPTLQLVVVGEVSAIGGEIAWQFRRSS